MKITTEKVLLRTFTGEFIIIWKVSKFSFSCRESLNQLIEELVYFYLELLYKKGKEEEGKCIIKFQ